MKSITALAFTLTLALTQTAQATDWLRLEVTGAIEGPSGGDKLVETHFIQRVNTVGGKEPTTPCTDALLNTRQLVNYEADYYFYTKERAHR